MVGVECVDKGCIVLGLTVNVGENEGKYEEISGLHGVG